jgi:hypothetical protein
MGGRLRSTVTFKGDYQGKQAATVNYLGETEPVETTERYGDTPNMELNHERRWVRPRKFHWGKLVDTDDELFTGIGPQGKYVEAAGKGFARVEDRVILASFFKDAYTGELGATTESWADDTSGAGENVVGVAEGGANTGLNMAKLSKAIRLLGNFNVDVDSEEIHMAITWQEWADIFALTAVTTSSDYVDGRPFSTGKLPTMFGINFHIFAEATFEKVTDLAVAANVRVCPMWTKSGMHLASWQDRTTAIARRIDKQNKPQIYMDQFYNATRLEPGKVIKVKTYH